jgi:uncharacterized protein YjiS (DUF1127 family)
MLRQTETMHSTSGRWGMDPAEFEARLAAARKERAEVLAQIGRAIARGFKGLFAGVGGSLRRRAAYDELYALDDRMLRDIGLSRGQLWAAVEGHVERGPSNDNRAAAAANENAPKHRAA